MEATNLQSTDVFPPLIAETPEPHAMEYKTPKSQNQTPKFSNTPPDSADIIPPSIPATEDIENLFIFFTDPPPLFLWAFLSFRTPTNQAPKLWFPMNFFQYLEKEKLTTRDPVPRTLNPTN